MWTYEVLEARKVENNSISKFNLEKMAEEMEVIQTYNAYKDRDPFNPTQTFSRMIDEES